jgi:hypothetical protein
MNRKLLPLILVGLLLFLSSCQTNRFTGQWTLEVQVEQVSAPECSNSFLGKEETHYFQLAQDGVVLSGSPISSLEPNAEMNANAGWKILGEADGNKVDLYFWIPNTPDTCGDVNHFAGERNGNVISGNYQGGDCHSYPKTDSPAGRIVAEEVQGEEVESCTWSGTFTMTMYEQK